MVANTDLDMYMIILFQLFFGKEHASLLLEVYDTELWKLCNSATPTNVEHTV